jgi:hypothetical protein
VVLWTGSGAQGDPVEGLGLGLPSVTSLTLQVVPDNLDDARVARLKTKAQLGRESGAALQWRADVLKGTRLSHSQEIAPAHRRCCETKAKLALTPGGQHAGGRHHRLPVSSRVHPSRCTGLEICRYEGRSSGSHHSSANALGPSLISPSRAIVSASSTGTSRISISSVGSR